MPTFANVSRFLVLVPITVAFLAGCASSPHLSKLSLQGSAEVPPVTTSAKGKGEITVLPDMSVSGKVTYAGFEATAAHIHQGAPGKNGPVIVTLTETAKGTFAVPAGTKLKKPQFDAYKAGNLYVNIHSAKHKGGEIRAQIVPPAPK